MKRKQINVLILCLFLIFEQSCNGKTLKIGTRCENGKERMVLMDNLLNENEVSWLNEYLVQHKPWVLNQGDHFKDINTTWVSPVTEIFQRTRIWKTMSNILKQISGSQQYLCSAMFTLAYRLDLKPVSSLANNGLMVQIFLNQDMKKNDYGEIVFYNNANEIICSIHQHPGRVVIWNSTVKHISKPPSMMYVQTQNTVVLKLTSSFEEYEKCVKANGQAVINSKSTNFPFTGDDKLECLQHGNINYKEHLTNKYYDSQGHEIAVFDDILTPRDLQRLTEHLTNDYHSFGFQPYDSEQSEDHDNVAWISVQKSDVLTQSGLWQVVKQTARFLSGSNQWYPYDVSMNIVHSFHHTRIHEDCEPSEYEYTFLLYLNPDWSENLYGETVYFDQVKTAGEPGDEEYEIVAAVRPRYGRIVMFRGIIPHSARPPSPGFHNARYTFACKVSETYRSAKSKKLRETLEALQEFGLRENDIQLSEDYESYEQQAPDDVVNAELTKQKEILQQLVQERQQYLVSKLSE